MIITFVILKIVLICLIGIILYIYEKIDGRQLYILFYNFVYYYRYHKIKSKLYLKIINSVFLMRFSRNRRKFYTRSVTLFLIVVQIVDINIYCSQEGYIFTYQDLVKNICLVIFTFSLLYYQWADKVILSIQHSGLMSSIGILFIVGISLNPNYYIITETMYILMLASCFYPKEIKKEEEQEEEEEEDEEYEDEDEFEEYKKKLKEIEGEVDILSSRLDKVSNEFNKMKDNLSISEENEKP